MLKEHIIDRIQPGSIAEELGIEPGDVLVSVNDHEIEDVFDYHYYTDEEYLTAIIRKKDGEEWELEIEKEYEALGLTQGEDGFWLYQNEPIRIFHDKMLGCWQTKEDGAVDVSVQRDRLGYATSVTVWRQGEREFEEQILLREAAR